ncbi:MAG: 6-bladed beta-propeller [Chloroflexi bacterium]|nr:6-bladed beta-propeller [Chloroflexota bacterium]
MAIAPDGTIYVCNRSYENRPDGVHITVITMDEEYITEFGAYGEADGEFMWPTSVVLDSKGNLYLADEWLNRITKFTKDGEFVSKWGAAGSGDGELKGPSGLAIDADDNMIIVDSGNNRVQKFTLDGKYISQFGSEGDGDGQFNLPWGIDVDVDSSAPFFKSAAEHVLVRSGAKFFIRIFIYKTSCIVYLIVDINGA